jgi:uncharacterized protein
LLSVSAQSPSAEVPWTTEFCRMKKKESGLKNIYMELGSSFGQLVTTNPTACAHLLGQLVDAFGADHVLWGTDSAPSDETQQMNLFQQPATRTRAGLGC